MKITRRKATLLALKFALSGLLLWLVLRHVQVDVIVARLRSFDWRFAVLTFALWMLNLFLASWRWSILSLRLIPLGQAFRYSWIGFFFGSVLPGAISGDVAKGVSLGLKDKSHGPERLAASIFLDKLVGFFMLLVFFTIASGWLLFGHPEIFGHLRPLVLIGLAGCLGGLAGLIICWRGIGSPRALHWSEKLPYAPLRHYAGWMVKAFAPYRHENRAILLALILSVVIHSVIISVYWIMFTAVNTGASLLFAAVFYPLISIILLVPVSISGIGMRESFSVMMFSAFGLQPEAGVAVSWLMLALNAPIVVVGGLIQVVEFFRHGHHSNTCKS
jgi:uncharacterized protein (TIRG00374 family)